MKVFVLLAYFISQEEEVKSISEKGPRNGKENLKNETKLLDDVLSKTEHSLIIQLYF